MQTANERGGKAYTEGWTLMDNPYNRSTKEWDLWREGFKLEHEYWRGQTNGQRGQD